MSKANKKKQNPPSRTEEINQQKTTADAHREAEKDILQDPELSDPDETDDLDEGELARKDNSDEEAADQFSK